MKSTLLIFNHYQPQRMYVHEVGGEERCWRKMMERKTKRNEVTVKYRLLMFSSISQISPFRSTEVHRRHSPATGPTQGLSGHSTCTWGGEGRQLLMILHRVSRCGWGYCFKAEGTKSDAEKPIRRALSYLDPGSQKTCLESADIEVGDLAIKQ